VKVNLNGLTTSINYTEMFQRLEMKFSISKLHKGPPLTTYHAKKTYTVLNYTPRNEDVWE